MHRQALNVKIPCTSSRVYFISTERTNTLHIQLWICYIQKFNSHNSHVYIQKWICTQKYIFFRRRLWVVGRVSSLKIPTFRCTRATPRFHNGNGIHYEFSCNSRMKGQALHFVACIYGSGSQPFFYIYIYLWRILGVKNNHSPALQLQFKNQFTHDCITNKVHIHN